MLGGDYDEEQEMKDELEARSTADQDKAFDDKDDQTCFEISIVNKHNEALSLDARVYNGEITFNKVNLIRNDALKVVNQTWLQRSKSQSVDYTGPKFAQLSEPVQDALVEYIYAAGIRPEIGIVIEWLSWNKEQRLYMSWLKGLYSHLFMSDKLAID